MKIQSHLSLPDVEAARGRLATGLRRTPCMIAPALSELVGMRIWIKREDLQRTGSFKERGARHALLCLTSEERGRGVVAASAGNHGLGLAYHGASLGVRVTVVVPRRAPEVKVARCRALGADVVIGGDTFTEAQAEAAALAASRGAALVHPFDDARVIAGQGTLALEFLEQAPEIDMVAVPVGGGGLLAGVAVAVKSLRPDVRVVGVQAARAPAFATAWSQGAAVNLTPTDTLADGLAVSRAGELTLAIARRLVDDVVTVTEAEIAAAIALLAGRAGIVAEGAGAAAIAAVLAGKVRGRAIVAPISGRNIEPRLHADILAREGHVAPPLVACAA